MRLLLVLVVVVALPCSWLAAEMKKARQQKEAVEAITKLDGRIRYDYELNARNQPRLHGWDWLRNLLEDDFFIDVVQADLTCDAQMAPLTGLSQRRELYVPAAEVTDAGLQYIKNLTQLEALQLDDTQITDAGLAHLAGLTKLEVLSLDRTQITDAGLQRLYVLTKERKAKRL